MRLLGSSLLMGLVVSYGLARPLRVQSDWPQPGGRNGRP